MPNKRGTADTEIARIAAQQHGVVTTRQLLTVGLSRAAISERTRRGRLHAVHRGVYAVGHPALCIEGRWMAAALACGEGAVVSHASAAALWGLLQPLSGPIDIAVPTYAGRRRRRGIRVHRCATLARRDGVAGLADMAEQKRHASVVTVRNRIPVTTVARTIEDLRGAVSPRLVRRATRQAEIAGLPLGPGVKTDRTRSDLEGDFLQLCRRAGLPAPKVNVRVGRWTVDFLWPDQRLAVETDSLAYHKGTVAFEDDHARDLDLRGRGYEVRRFSERQVLEEPARVGADLATALRSE